MQKDYGRVAEQNRKRKTTIRLRGMAWLWIERLAEQWFDGDTARAIEWCVDFQYRRTVAGAHVMDVWVELPNYRLSGEEQYACIGETQDVKLYWVRFTEEVYEWMESLLNQGIQYEGKNGTRDISMFPQLKNLRRNVISQCVMMTMFDVVYNSIEHLTKRDIEKAVKV